MKACNEVLKFEKGYSEPGVLNKIVAIQDGHAVEKEKNVEVIFICERLLGIIASFWKGRKQFMGRPDQICLGQYPALSA